MPLWTLIRSGCFAGMKRSTFLNFKILRFIESVVNLFSPNYSLPSDWVFLLWFTISRGLAPKGSRESEETSLWTKRDSYSLYRPKGVHTDWYILLKIIWRKRLMGWAILKDIEKRLNRRMKKKARTASKSNTNSPIGRHLLGTCSRWRLTHLGCTYSASQRRKSRLMKLNSHSLRQWASITWRQDSM